MSATSVTDPVKASAAGSRSARYGVSRQAGPPISSGSHSPPLRASFEACRRRTPHPPALVVGYGTPPDSGFATAVNLLCAVLG